MRYWKRPREFGSLLLSSFLFGSVSRFSHIRNGIPGYRVLGTPTNYHILVVCWLLISVPTPRLIVGNELRIGALWQILRAFDQYPHRKRNGLANYDRFTSAEHRQ